MKKSKKFCDERINGISNYHLKFLILNNFRSLNYKVPYQFYSRKPIKQFSGKSLENMRTREILYSINWICLRHAADRGGPNLDPRSRITRRATCIPHDTLPRRPRCEPVVAHKAGNSIPTRWVILGGQTDASSLPTSSSKRFKDIVSLRLTKIQSALQYR